jgi:MIP family channel proteins
VSGAPRQQQRRRRRRRREGRLGSHEADALTTTLTSTSHPAPPPPRPRAACSFTQDGGITTARQMEVSLIFGNAITILVFIFAGISGANINPAVSFALFVSKKMSWIRCLCYTIAQCLGAMTGAGMVRIMTPAMFDKVDGGANEISANANSREALGVEFGCTFMLVMTVMAATDTHRAEKHQHLPTIAPIVIGMAVTAAHFIAIPVDNCSINPARCVGGAVWRVVWLGGL